jgi:hypothetical protein
MLAESARSTSAPDCHTDVMRACSTDPELWRPSQRASLEKRKALCLERVTLSVRVPMAGRDVLIFLGLLHHQRFGGK